eukprot:scaffold2580_cov388-Prasinococcus_capsulatus_cf.AAC.27
MRTAANAKLYSQTQFRPPEQNGPARDDPEASSYKNSAKAGSKLVPIFRDNVGYWQLGVAACKETFAWDPCSQFIVMKDKVGVIDQIASKRVPSDPQRHLLLGLVCRGDLASGQASRMGRHFKPIGAGI